MIELATVLGWLSKLALWRRSARRETAEVALIEANVQVQQVAAASAVTDQAVDLVGAMGAQLDRLEADAKRWRGRVRRAHRELAAMGDRLERVERSERRCRQRVARITAECAERSASDGRRIDELRADLDRALDAIDTDDIAPRASRTPPP